MKIAEVLEQVEQLTFAEGNELLRELPEFYDYYEWRDNGYYDRCFTFKGLEDAGENDIVSYSCEYTEAVENGETIYQDQEGSWRYNDL